MDVRTAAEWQEVHIAGAAHLPLDQLAERLGEIDRGRHLAVICGSGYRSSIATSILMNYSFGKVANVLGVMAAWKAAEYPTVKG